MYDFTDGYAMLNRAEREMGGGNPGPVLDRLCDELTGYRAALGEHWAEFTKAHFAHHPIQKRLHESPFSRRAYLKPRGYPGDAVTIDYTYGLNPLDRASGFGRALYEWEYDSACCRSVRSRRDFTARGIDETALATPRARVLSVACGHLREASESHAVREGMLGEFIALDQDSDSLAVVAAEYP